MRPAYMDEYERLEIELERLYAMYIDKFRNLDYMENQLELFHKKEEEEFRHS